MGQLIHVVFQFSGSAVAIPAAAAAAVAAAHAQQVSGFLPGTHGYNAVHSAPSRLRYSSRPDPAVERPH